MNTKEIIDAIDEHLQEVNSDRNERIKRINEILDFVNYNLRFTELNEEELKDFVYCNEGYPITPRQKMTLELNPERQNYFIEMWARSTYFRRCAWLQYLTGETKQKPSLTKKES